MGKRDDLKLELQSILTEPDKLHEFLIQHSNLPGRRANLELIDAFADVNKDLALVKQWIEIPEDSADVNDPKAFLAYSAAVSLGQIYADTRNEEIIPVLKELAKDGRWRMRECVAFGFQRIGEKDFSHLQKICTDWVPQADNYARRCILVSLAHPPFLDKDRAKFCINLANTILEHLDVENEESFRILRKGLDFTLSVFVKEAPSAGFEFLNSWIRKNKVIDSIIKTNLTKKRLTKFFPQKVALLLDFLEIK